MKKLIRIVMIFMPSCCRMGASLTYHITIYNSLIKQQRPLKKQTVMNIGTNVYFFRNGTLDVKKARAVNNDHGVYQLNSLCDI